MHCPSVSSPLRKWASASLGLARWGWSVSLVFVSRGGTSYRSEEPGKCDSWALILLQSPSGARAKRVYHLWFVASQLPRVTVEMRVGIIGYLWGNFRSTPPMDVGMHPLTPNYVGPIRCACPALFHYPILSAFLITWPLNITLYYGSPSLVYIVLDICDDVP